MSAKKAHFIVQTASAPDPEIEVLFSADQIASRLDELAESLAKRLPSEIVVVPLLKGSFMFAADLMRMLHKHGLTCRVEFITVSSYGNDTTSSGELKISSDLPEDLVGNIVLLIDDILDTGRTLHWTHDNLLAAGAAEIVTCVLLDKPSRRIVPFEADFVGFTIPDRFVVGYGIDYAQRYRELPYIGAMPG
ncbi:MAG: hypoxanthine phosphoribosyltransferase [Alphaproteobacteria bacterium]